MHDKYLNFEELRRQEVEGRDYRISCVERGSSILIVAPHAGGIEPGTTEIAMAIGGNDLSVYCFEGIKGSENKPLHITSTRFKEPRCEKMLRSAKQVVAIHGEQSETDLVYLGGLDHELCEKVASYLSVAGFDVDRDSRPDLSGTDSSNVCNRGMMNKGVQLELGSKLRSTFFEDLKTRKGRQKTTDRFNAFVTAVRGAIQPDQ